MGAHTDRHRVRAGRASRKLLGLVLRVRACRAHRACRLLKPKCKLYTVRPFNLYRGRARHRAPVHATPPGPAPAPQPPAAHFRLGRSHSDRGLACGDPAQRVRIDYRIIKTVWRMRSRFPIPFVKAPSVISCVHATCNYCIDRGHRADQACFSRALQAARRWAGTCFCPC